MEQQENKNNVMPLFKLGQGVSFNYTTTRKGVLMRGVASGTIIGIQITKDHLHLKYLAPDIFYKIKTGTDSDDVMELSEKFLIDKLISVSENYAIDDKPVRATY